MPYNFSQFKTDAKKVEDFLAKEYRELNVGRASPAVLDGISVEAYGTRMPLKNVANISIEDPKTLRLLPFDKSQIKDIEKAIASANLGLSVATDDKGIRVIFPQLTTESRASLVKVLKEKLEEARIALRREREKVLNEINKLTEDEKFRGKEELQKIIDQSNKNLEDSFTKKEKEVMG